MKNFINSFYDDAERNIELASEYIDILTKDSKERQDIYQTTEFTRKEWSIVKKAPFKLHFTIIFNFRTNKWLKPW